MTNKSENSYFYSYFENLTPYHLNCKALDPEIFPLFKGVHLCEGGISNAFSGMFVRRTNSKMTISLTLF